MLFLFYRIVEKRGTDGSNKLLLGRFIYFYLIRFILSAEIFIIFLKNIHNFNNRYMHVLDKFESELLFGWICSKLIMLMIAS